MAMLSRPKRRNWQPPGSGGSPTAVRAVLTRLLSRYLRPARFVEVSRDVTAAPLPMPPLDLHHRCRSRSSYTARRRRRGARRELQCCRNARLVPTASLSGC